MAENIFMKLVKMRVELQRMNIKKSGHNDYSNYDYYELADILPPINDLQEKYKTCSFVTFTNEVATLTMVNAEAPEEMIQFTSPMAELSLKAANPVQNLGGVETYQRRYLYMAAFEIVENDYFDATQGKEQNQQQNTKNTTKKKTAELSEATANALNNAIKQYSALTGIAAKTITSHIIKSVGKSLQEITEQDAKQILKMIDEWARDHNSKQEER